MKKIIVLVVSIFIFICPSLFAGKMQDQLIDAVTEGSYKDIKKTFYRYTDYINENMKPDGKTLLDYALEHNREYKIIKYLVKSGVKINNLTDDKQNALMFACQYSSDPKVIEYIIKKAKLTKSGRKKFIMLEDSTGENCFDYALKNENKHMAVEVLSKYAPNPYGDYEGEEDEILPEIEPEIEVEAEPVAVIPVPAPAPAPIAPPPVEPVVKDEKEAPKTPILEPKKFDESLAERFTELDDLEEVEEPIVEEEPPVDPLASVLFALETDDNPLTPNRKTYLFDDSDLEDENAVPFDDFTENDRNYIENPNKKDKFGRTPLMIASQKGDIEKIKDLLYSGADVQAKDNDGWTALMFAARYQTNPDVTNILIKSGAVVTVKNNHEISALNYAAGFNTNPMVLTTLLKNRSISEKEVRGAFIYAICSQAPIAILNVFLKKGIQVNVSFEGKTPLMYAAESNDSTQIISWLLENGATTTLRTARGKTAFDYATENTKLPRDGVYWALNGEL